MMSRGNPPLYCIYLDYIIISRHARPSNNSKQVMVQYIMKQVVTIIYNKNAIKPYNNRGLESTVKCRGETHRYTAAGTFNMPT